MGILDQVTNKLGSGGNPMLGTFLKLFNQFGGIGGLIAKFQQNGLGHIAQSWIGKSQPLPVEPEQLRSTLGNDFVNQTAESSGLPPNMMLQQLSQHLPGVVNKLTPDGQVPTGQISEEQLSKAGIGDMLKGFMERKTA
jgi:uncharacterized protein YidB (DUF937 family)